MSSPEEVAALIQEVASLKAASYCAVVVPVIILYEYMITVGKEVQLFWNRKVTGASVLFFLNRYIVLGLNLYALPVTSIPVSDGVRQNTSVLLLYLTISMSLILEATTGLQIAQYVPWAAFTALRAFALGRMWFASVLALLLSLVPVAVNLANYSFGVSGQNEPLFGCITVEGISFDLAKKFTIVSRTCLITTDVLLITITWSTLRHRIHQEDPTTSGKLFTNVLLRDGTIYFIALLVMNSLHLAFTMLSIARPDLQAVSLVPLFTEPVTATLVSRFLLNLQSVNQKVVGEDISSLGSVDGAGSLMFNRVIGSLASSVIADADLGGDFEDVAADDVYELESPTNRSVPQKV